MRHPIKYAIEFNKCDCLYHEEIFVSKCTENEFFVKKKFDLEKKCTCTPQLSCRFCLSRLFMLNYKVYKVCVWDNKFQKN